MNIAIGILFILVLTFAFWMFNLWDWHRLVHPNESFFGYLRKWGKG